jgi:hypothetical protein
MLTGRPAPPHLNRSALRRKFLFAEANGVLPENLPLAEDHPDVEPTAVDQNEATFYQAVSTLKSLGDRYVSLAIGLLQAA